ncbi:MAG: hypothetical protein HQL07_05830 [Nitrospirae bacterium]|nr:hypothetical protein [Magnetococcales bacterium]HAT51127.1 hypothetical protein [Alphaproteobacteria bacterium]
MRYCKYKISIIAILILNLIPVDVNAFWGNLIKNSAEVASDTFKLGKVQRSLPEEEIVKLSNMIQKAHDIDKVKDIIGKMNLPLDAIEDTFMRIAIQQKKINQNEAEIIFKNLHGVDGFRGTVGKVIGFNIAGTKGHLNELKISNAAVENGFNVEKIGERFDDGIKKRMTDIDVFLSKNGKYFPIEAKAYDNILFENMIMIRRDMESLVSYKNSSSSPSNIYPIFTFTNRPADPSVLKIIQKESENKGVNVIFGSPEEQIIQLNQLINVL